MSLRVRCDVTCSRKEKGGERGFGYRPVLTLACLLHSIKQQRDHQSNFQLVIITHDEAFLEMLHRYGHARTYYRVSKNPRLVKLHFARVVV